ncbi:hypothetical protein MFC_01370 [Mesomycoplasma flocculare ATCC 27716]|nr:hypothetical protein MFC_01370 [Mesomycoplasma flocculare ATCC 27716]
MVEFISQITISKEEIDNSEITVYETLNPENKQMIRLEISNENLTIFSGENTLFFELNKEINNIFFNNNSKTIVSTFLKKFEKKANLISIEYDLFLKVNNKMEKSGKIATYITNLEFLND